MLEMVYNPTTTTALKFISLLHNLVISYVKLVIEFVGVNGFLNTSEWNIAARSVLMPGLVDLQKFMFLNKYHLTASVLVWVCPSMTGLMLWITSFNRCKTFILMLPLNLFLKVRVAYFKANSITSSAFQCSATGAPPNSTSSTINILILEGPFFDEMGPSSVVWRDCHFAGCAGAFLQFPKCFSKLFTWVMALPH